MPTLKIAITKICPQGVAAGRPGNCIGNLCAAWRWGEYTKPTFYKAEDRTAVVQPARPSEIGSDWTFHPHDENEDTAAGWMEPDDAAQTHRRGFCGLAGEEGYP